MSHIKQNLVKPNERKHQAYKQNQARKVQREEASITQNIGLVNRVNVPVHQVYLSVMLLCCKYICDICIMYKPSVVLLALQRRVCHNKRYPIEQNIKIKID